MKVRPRCVIVKQQNQSSCCCKRIKGCTIIEKIIKFFKVLICFLKARSSDTVVFGSRNTKVKNILTIPRIVCPGEEFILDLEAIVQVCCNILGSQGSIVVDSINGKLTGPAKIINFTTKAVSKCLSGCPEGTVVGTISPNGKEIALVFSEFVVKADSNIRGQSFIKKCCKTSFELAANESSKDQTIRFEGAVRGFAALSQGCDGPFDNAFQSDFIIETRFVSSKHPCCREGRKRVNFRKYVHYKDIKSKCRQKHTMQGYIIKMKKKFDKFH